MRPGKNGAVRPPGTATSSGDRDIYECYATGLYRQAFLTLGDSALAEHVVRDVIVDECVLGIRPRDMAALLRTALLRLGTSPAE